MKTSNVRTAQNNALKFLLVALIVVGSALQPVRAETAGGINFPQFADSVQERASSGARSTVTVKSGNDLQFTYVTTPGFPAFLYPNADFMYVSLKNISSKKLLGFSANLNYIGEYGKSTVEQIRTSNLKSGDSVQLTYIIFRRGSQPTITNGLYSLEGGSNGGGGPSNGGGGPSNGGGGTGGGGGAVVSYAKLVVEGQYGYSISNNSIRMTLSKLANRGTGTSGSLKIDVWATSGPYQTSKNGYIIATSYSGPLRDGYYRSIDETVSLSKIPPKGYYYITYVISEYDGASYKARAFVYFTSGMTVRSRQSKQSRASDSGETLVLPTRLFGTQRAPKLDATVADESSAPKITAPAADQF